MWRCEDVKMWRCEDEKMWRWADVKMWRCEDEQMWRWEDVKMWRWEDVKMWGWEDVKMSRCEDVKMRRCEDVKMWGWEDVKMNRCEDVNVWRWWEDVKMRRCEDVRMAIVSLCQRLRKGDSMIKQLELGSRCRSCVAPSCYLRKLDRTCHILPSSTMFTKLPHSWCHAVKQLRRNSFVMQFIQSQQAWAKRIKPCTKFRGCVNVWRWWENVKMRRCEDEKMWRCEDVKMWGCEDEKMWRWEDERQTPTIGRTLRSDALGKKLFFISKSMKFPYITQWKYCQKNVFRSGPY